MRKLLIPAFALILCFPAARCGAQEHSKDTLATVKKKLAEKKAVLVDVREQSEWDEGHVRGAIFLPLSKLRSGLDPKELARALPKDKVIYCHCRSGGRSLKAAEVLKKQGYDIRPLKPGYAELIDAGFPKAEK